MRRRTKRLLATVLGLGLAVAVAVAAILVPGYQVLRPALDSATVWVVNSASGQIGAANTEVAQLQDVTRVPRGSLSAVQSESGVLLVDATNGTLRSVDPRSAVLGPPVPIPPDSDVQIRDDHVLVTDVTTGDASLTTIQAVTAGEALQDPVLQLGGGGVAVLGDARVVAVSPGLGRVIEHDIATGETAESRRASISPSNPDLQLTAVGDTWILYDSTSGTISTSSWSRQLDHEGVRLQQPSESGGGVIIATDESLLRIVPGTTGEQTLVSGLTGSPAAPLVHDGCVFAAWSGGAGWRDCGGEESLVNLEGMDAGGTPLLQARGASVVVSEPDSGAAWALSGDGERIDDWLEPADEQAHEGEGDEEAVPDTAVETTQQPPVAEDDEFGARPGAVSVLPVTRNDADPNGDPLMVTDVRGHDGATITDSGQEIRLEVGADERDPINLRYTVTDGRGGEDTASVEVTLREPDENSAPEQLVETSLIAMSGGHASVDALADWVDPDGDALTLVGVASESPDQATARPDGRLELHDGGAGGIRRYTVTVSDGELESEGVVTVSTTAQPELTAEPVTRSARVGQRVEIDPLLSAHGGEGPISLHNVELPGDDIGVVRYDSGSLSLQPTEEGELVFPYVVTDGVTTAQGQIRVIVGPEETASSPPLPLPQGIALPPLGSARIDLASSAADPAGGALTVTSVTSSSGTLRATLADLGIVHLELTAPLAEPATVEYTLSNGIASSAGTIVVSEGRQTSQAPIARDDTVRASPGQAVTLMPLANDEHPSLAPLELLPDLVTEPDAGVMFTDGSAITYLAPDEPGTYVGVYEVEGPDGQRSSAEVVVAVGEAGEGSNQAPDAPTLHARVLAGESVDISVPLAGADPNGDPVQLLGQSSTASLGTISRVDATTFRYTAGGYSEGTDVVRYLVSDDRGMQAEGTLTIAVTPRADVEAQPRAVSDHAEMRPETSLAVDVLANDVDAASLPLSITGIDVTRGDADAEIVDGAIVVAAGAEEGDVGIVYTVENSLGATSVAWLTVDVRSDAEPPRPVGGDIDVPLTNVLDADAVVVDPLEAATVADGRTDLLEIEVAGGGDDIAVTGDGTLSIPVLETRRELAYRVTRSDTEDSAYGIVRVPGTRDSLPQLRPGVEPIRVANGETVRIDINEYIVAATGRPVWITDASKVRPTQSNGDPIVRDAQTLEFTPATGYAGPANISLEVTDGDSPQDPDGRIGLVVLPINVVLSDDSPPTLMGTTFTVEPGETRTVDLARMTIDPADDPSLLAYRIDEHPQADIALTQSGSELTMQVAPDAQVGAVQAARVGVASGGVEGVAGELLFSVVSSTRPLVQTAPDSVDIRRGSSERVEPLTNDEATNPFSEPLVIDRVVSSAPGVRAAIAGDSRTVSVAAASTAAVEVVTVRYRVLDATRSPDRAVWGTIRVRVQDVPDRPEAPRQITDRFERGTLFVRVTPPAANNSELTSIRLRDQFGDTHECSLSGICTVTGLDSDIDYRFTAIAANAVGPSEPSPVSGAMHIDALPNPVTGIRAQPTDTPGELRVTWPAATVPEGGTAVTGYLVRVTGPGISETFEAGANARSMPVGDLQVGETYRISIAAMNRANVSADMWRFTDPPHTATAVGRPGRTTVGIMEYGPGTISVAWAPPSPGGSASLRYTASVIPQSEQGAFRCTSGGGGEPRGQRGTEATLTLPPNRDSVVAVVADNGWFCSVSFSSTRAGRPGSVPSGTAVAIDVRDGAAAPRVTQLPQLRPNHRLQIQLRDGNRQTSWQDASEGSWVGMGPLEYGRSVEIHARQVVSSGGQDVAGQSRLLGTVVPFSLHATVPSSCTVGEPFDVQWQSNSVGAQTRAIIQVNLGDGWEEIDADEPLPYETRQVRARLQVTYDGNTYTNPNWQPRSIGLQCGL